MTEPNKDKKRHHVFDGIEECDNDMPRWWVNLFIITIIFSVMYLLWYNLPFFPSRSLLDEYYMAAKVANAQQTEQRDQAAKEGFNYLDAAKNPEMVSAGKEVFVTNCAPCHAADGGGSVGPNLTDRFWIHGDSPESIAATVTSGVVEKGMPAWEPILGIDKVRQVTAFIITLHGSKPAVAKEPQGVEIK